MGDGDAVQAFTAIRRVTSKEPYQVEQKAGFHPHRVDVDYLKDANEAPIKPLLEHLDPTRNRGSSWGSVMRGAKRKLDDTDFGMIAAAMGIADNLD